ncbi:MAG: hypothetical protein ACKOEM_02425 [Planctomycetia bacterium]
MFAQRDGVMGRGIGIAALAAVAIGLLAGSAGAETILASNYASSYTSWTNGSNQSTNFGNWGLTNNDGAGRFAGFFLGSSTAGAGDINTSGTSFGMYANPAGAFADALLPLNGQFAVGTTLRFGLGVNFDNGNKGFDLLAANGALILNWNLGLGASTGTSFTKTETTAQYNYGGAAALDVQLQLTSASTLAYAISRTSPLGFQGTLFQGTISGITSLPANLKFYVAGTDTGGAAQNNLYANSIEVVPEPAMAPLVVFGLVVPAVVSYRRMRRRLQAA